MSGSSGQQLIKTVKEYGKSLFSFIRGRVGTAEDAEDILQDVWVQLSQAVDAEEIEQVSSWLYRVAQNKITDRYRKKKTEALEDFIMEDEDGEFTIGAILLADEDDPETVYLKDVFWQELFVALNELPENQRQVFVWNELEDKTLQQIADETGEKLKTIISRKGYAVKHLRARLESLYKELLNY